MLNIWIWGFIISDAQARIDNLWEHGVQVLGTINPYIYQDSAMFMYANEKNYLIKNLHGAAYIVNHDSSRCGLVDLTHPDAFEWFKGSYLRFLGSEFCFLFPLPPEPLNVLLFFFLSSRCD